MENKLNYLIWREKNGFFSALDVDGEMHTWSMASGRHLYEQNFVHQEKNGDSTNLLKKIGDEGDRSPDLPHAKRTLYH